VRPATSAGNVDKFIQSASNSVYRELLGCLTSRGIKKSGYFLVSGERAVRDTLEHFPKLARSLIIPANNSNPLGAPHSAALSSVTGSVTGTVPGSSSSSSSSKAPSAVTRTEDTPLASRDGEDACSSDLNSTLELSESTQQMMQNARKLTAQNQIRFSVLACTSALFEELDVAGTKKPLLLVQTPEIPPADLSLAPVGLEIVCALSDPSNLGALIRSASAFGISKVILLKESASPFHPKAVRAASAATLAVCLERGPSIQELAPFQQLAKDANLWVALDMGGESLVEFKWPKNARLVLGEEGRGLPVPNSFRKLAVPISREQVESLNATVASSIALYAYRAQYPLA
jgi:tRNA G18 (ribose-2'-O)-methylase SpoU